MATTDWDTRVLEAFERDVGAKAVHQWAEDTERRASALIPTGGDDLTSGSISAPAGQLKRDGRVVDGLDSQGPWSDARWPRGITNLLSKPAEQLIYPRWNPADSVLPFHGEAI